MLAYLARHRRRSCGVCAGLHERCWLVAAKQVLQDAALVVAQLAHVALNLLGRHVLGFNGVITVVGFCGRVCRCFFVHGGCTEKERGSQSTLGLAW